MLTHWFAIALLLFGMAVVAAMPWVVAWNNIVRERGSILSGLFCAAICVLELCMLADWALGW